MNNRLISAVLAIIQLMAFFIIAYAMKLSAKFDPDVRGIELIIMGIIWLATLGIAMVHIYDLIFPRITKETTYEDFIP